MSWMNYAWRYDNLRGPGKFYSSFNYSFSKTELEFIRHSPSKVSLFKISRFPIVNKFIYEGQSISNETFSIAFVFCS